MLFNGEVWGTAAQTLRSLLFRPISRSSPPPPASPNQIWKLGGSGSRVVLAHGAPLHSLPANTRLFFFSLFFLVLPVCFNLPAHWLIFTLEAAPPHPSLSFCCYFGPQFFVLEPQVGTRKSKGFALVFSARVFAAAAAACQRLLGSWLRFPGLSTVTPTD